MAWFVETQAAVLCCLFEDKAQLPPTHFKAVRPDSLLRTEKTAMQGSRWLALRSDAYELLGYEQTALGARSRAAYVTVVLVYMQQRRQKHLNAALPPLGPKANAQH